MGKLIICKTKINADIIPVNAINLSAIRVFADLIYAHKVPKLNKPVAAETWTFINPSGTCMNIFYSQILLLQTICNKN